MTRVHDKYMEIDNKPLWREKNSFFFGARVEIGFTQSVCGLCGCVRKGIFYP